MFHNPIDRRVFLKGAGASFMTSISCPSYARTLESDTVFASAFMHQSGTFGVLIFDQFGKTITHFDLPARGHDIAFNPETGVGVTFARRPGNFALVFDIKNQFGPQIITAPKGRHFYGHGVFSHNGKLLYTAENNFDDGTGIIGIYDATNKFIRVGEVSSFGIGPHEILLHPNKDILLVANGGIETHPDYGRAKLNIATMQPSLCFIRADSGELIEKHVLSKHFHKLSIRHMDVDLTGRIIFGCQYEGDRSDRVPLIGTANLGDEATLWETPKSILDNFANYVGSVSYLHEYKTAAVTLPKGNQIAILDTKTGDVKKIFKRQENFGVVAHNDNFLSTSARGTIHSSSGKILTNNSSIMFDNHLKKLL